MSTRIDPISAGRVQHVEILNKETGPLIRGYKADESMSCSPTDEIRLDFSMFIGRPTINKRGKDTVGDRNLLIELSNCRSSGWDFHPAGRNNQSVSGVGIR